MNVDELLALSEDAQQLIEKKQHQRLHAAYMQFEKIAEDNDTSISEILESAKSLEKKRNIKYRDTKDSDNTWTGRGRKPTWLVNALAAGSHLDDFAI